MRHQPLLVANWKMYVTVSDGIVIATSLKKALADLRHIEVVLCPPSIMLPLVHDAIMHHPLGHLHLGVQNVSTEPSGPYTGEISAPMVKGFCRYAIVGHSERVKWFGETPTQTNKKIKEALAHGVTPIVCVGERKRNNDTKEEVLTIVQQLLVTIAKTDYHKLVIAYEPVWAISQGDPDHHHGATGEYAQRGCKAIRTIVGEETRILYGGSTNPDNIAEFLDQEDIDGALVGAASVDVKEFLTMCEIASSLNV